MNKHLDYNRQTDRPEKKQSDRKTVFPVDRQQAFMLDRVGLVGLCTIEKRDRQTGRQTP